ncbi:uncharacterized protein ACB058_014822 [Synchiropus picturatus]
MTRVALLKLLILGLIAFLVCIPEFFITDKVGRVKLSCLPCRHCEQQSQVGKVGDGSKRMDNLSDITGGETWQQACVQTVSRSVTAGNNAHLKFTCKTYGVMEEVQIGFSSSGYVEVLVEVQLRDKEFLNLTLYGWNNQSSLQLHLPDEEEEERDEDLMEAFHCCVLSGRDKDTSCLLWISNQTLLGAADRGMKLEPRDDWHSVFRVLWLVLLCVAVLTMASVILDQIYKKERRRKRSKELRDVHWTGTLLTEKGNYTSNQTSTGRAETHSPDSLRLASGLDPIQEVEVSEDVEILLVGSDSCYENAYLHHRSQSSSTSGDIEEPSC